MTFEVDCRYDRQECVIDDLPDGRRTCRHMADLNSNHPAPDYDPKDRSSQQPGKLYTENEWWPQWCTERCKPRD